jgi:hypothetical protein
MIFLLIALDLADVDAAREAFRKGYALAGDSQWGAALAAYERSYKLKPHPWTTFNIGICERALGQYVRAKKTFARALAERKPDAELPESAVQDSQRFGAEIERLLATLEVTLEPQAALAVDGQPLEEQSPGVFVAGTMPAGPGTVPHASTFKLVLDPGPHVFLLTRRGFADAVHRQTVRPGEASVLKLVLERLPGTLHIAADRERAVVTVDRTDVGLAPVTLTRPAGKYKVKVSRPGFVPYEVEANLQPGERVDLSASLKEEKPALTQRWWFWTAAGVVLAGAAAGTYFLTRPEPERPPPSGGGLGWVVTAP